MRTRYYVLLGDIGQYLTRFMGFSSAMFHPRCCDFWQSSRVPHVAFSTLLYPLAPPAILYHSLFIVSCDLALLYRCDYVTILTPVFLKSCLDVLYVFCR